MAGAVNPLPRVCHYQATLGTTVLKGRFAVADTGPCAGRGCLLTTGRVRSPT